MKKNFTIIAFLFLQVAFTSSSIAQFAPEKGNKQWVMGILDGRGLLLFNKYKSESLSTRYGLNLNYSISNSNNSYFNGWYVNDNFIPYLNLKNTNKQTNLNFSAFIGKQKHIAISNKLVPYVAVDLGVGISYAQQSTRTYTDDTTFSNSNNRSNLRLVSYNNENSTKRLSGYVFIRPAIGFNYYLSKGLAFGVEYQITVLRFGYTFLNETVTQYNYQYLDTNTNEIVNYFDRNYKTTSDSDYSISGGFPGAGYITLSYFF